MRVPEPARALIFLLVATAAAFFMFGYAPWIDLWATGFFFRTGEPFAATSGAFEALRLGVWRLSETVLLTCVGLLVLGVWSASPVLGIPARASGYIVAVYLLGPGLLVDVLLKRHWGRARPADVAEFGGLLRFTPPHVVSEQCTRNCSFVSGEVAGAVALAVALVTLRAVLRHRLPRWGQRALLLAAVATPVAVALQRVAGGRHFLSDTVFAALLVLLVAAVVRPLFFQAPQRPGAVLTTPPTPPIRPPPKG